MSKRSSRRLSLKKETLRSLDGRALEAVAGGTTTCVGSIGSTRSFGCETVTKDCGLLGGGLSAGGLIGSFTR